MKALQFDATGDLSALHYRDVPRPTLQPGEVLVKVEAAGLNPSDVKNVLGRFPYTTLPRIPGRDFAGVVIEGPSSMIGQAVWGTGKPLGFACDGSHAEFLTLPASGVAPLPKRLDFAQAAALGVPYVTAWDALERSGTGTGTRLLVIGGGAVATAAIRLGQARGAQVLVAARRDAQRNHWQNAGFDTIPLTHAGSLPVEVERHFRNGAEVIFDTTGFWLPAAVSALATFGRIAIIAAPVDGQVSLPALALYRRGGGLVGVNSLLYDVSASARMLESFGGLFDEGSIAPPSDLSVRPLAEGPACYRALDEGSSDKIIFRP